MVIQRESHTEFYQRWQDLARPYFAWQFSQFSSFLGKRVADLGCGLGNFTDFLIAKDYYLGIDYDKELLAVAANRFNEKKNVAFTCGDLTDSQSYQKLRAERIDTIICVNVLEHIKDDAYVLGQMIDVLPVKGTLCLLVPAMPSIFGALDAFDHHYRRYSKQGLLSLLQKYPVEINSCYYFNLIGAAGWFVKSKIMKQKTQTSDNYTLMNRLIPIMARIEKALPPPLGMSLIAIMRKK